MPEFNQEYIDGLLKGIESAKEDAHKARQQSEDTKNLTMMALWVLVVAFAALMAGVGALFQSHLAAKTATYQDLIDKIVEQGRTLETIQSSLRGSEANGKETVRDDEVKAEPSLDQN